MNITQITSPALLINKPTVLRNIQRMAKKVSTHNITLKPHFKTHQSAEVGEWFREFGVDKDYRFICKNGSFFCGSGME